MHQIRVQSMYSSELPVKQHVLVWIYSKHKPLIRFFHLIYIICLRFPDNQKFYRKVTKISFFRSLLTQQCLGMR